MIVFRQVDADVPFFWEGDGQPAARWHDAGEGPVQYTSSTPEAAWAEFLRHSGIDDPDDLAGVVRVMWAIELPDDAVSAPAVPTLAAAVLRGGVSSYPACRAEARRLRRRGHRVLAAPCAALVPGGPSGWRVDGGLVPGPVPGPRTRPRTVVVFGPCPEAIGWRAGIGPPPEASLMERVKHLR